MKFGIGPGTGPGISPVSGNPAEKSDVIASAGFGGIHRAVADFHELGARAASRGLRVGCEVLAWGKHADVRT
ncbi:MAG: hypothetical protein JKY00_00490 [Roseicyclus sp.]|nr:hypothetical protein [Roseicyclus sp.]